MSKQLQSNEAEPAEGESNSPVSHKTEPNRAESSESESRRAESRRAEPNEAEPNEAEPNQAEPNQAEPNKKPARRASSEPNEKPRQPESSEPGETPTQHQPSRPTYPPTRRDDTVETLHGEQVADPYRWLEDPDSPETAAWVTAQNAVTDAHLGALASRDWFHDTLRRIVLRPRAGVPAKEGPPERPWYFVTRNTGEQPQDVLYVASSLDELLAGGRVLLDPNTWSADGTTSLAGYTVSDDGRYFAYLVSKAGSDWHTIRTRDLANDAELDDVVEQTKFSAATWLPDNASYLYLHFEGTADGKEAAALGAAKLMRHVVGTDQTVDMLLLEFPDDPMLTFYPATSHDGRWLVVTISAGTEPRNRQWVYPLTAGEQGTDIGAPVKLIDEPVAEYRFLRSAGDALYFSTDADAPNGRIVRIDVDAPGQPIEVVPAGGATLEFALAAGDELLAGYLDDVQPRITRYSLDGAPIGDVDVQGGAVVAAHGHVDDPEVFLGLTSVTAPTTAYRLYLGTSTVRALDELQAAAGPLAPEVVTERRRAISRDGTEVPYFLIRRAEVTLDQPRPTLLYGYGGFNIPVLADFRAGWPAWLAAGGVLVIANLRGGGEYGSTWHDGGRLDNKQNVFDDFVAVGEQLKADGVTTTGQLALHGRSNGGLLVGAVMTQRPDLAAVALPMVGVLDMLRFHRFTIGRAWISDYGSPDDAHQFAVVRAYSPLHNLREGTAYPATLVLTGDHDDRVVPAHSHKFTATLQRAHIGDAPVLTRIEVATGHGLGKPAAMLAAEWADLLAFAAEHTGLQPG